MLSRNFRLQKVGDSRWLKQSYDFSKIAFAIDELIILNVARGEKNIRQFAGSIKAIVDTCFIPVVAGGGIRSMEDAEILLSAGADKIAVNTALVKDVELVRSLVERYGSQCVIGSVDFKNTEGLFEVFTENGSSQVECDLKEYIDSLIELGAGEILLHSINRDGTGQGYCMEPLKEILEIVPVPVILSGGAGKYEHFIDALRSLNVDAVSTANLFNFIGDGFPQSRDRMIEAGIDLARWDRNEEKHLRNYFNIGGSNV